MLDAPSQLFCLLLARDLSKRVDQEQAGAWILDMVVLNHVSRYHLCILAMQRATRLHHLTPPFIQECNDMLTKHHSYIRIKFEDMPEVRDWVWTD